MSLYTLTLSVRVYDTVKLLLAATGYLRVFDPAADPVISIEKALKILANTNGAPLDCGYEVLSADVARVNGEDGE